MVFQCWCVDFPRSSSLRMGLPFFPRNTGDHARDNGAASLQRQTTPMGSITWLRALPEGGAVTSMACMLHVPADGKTSVFLFNLLMSISVASSYPRPFILAIPPIPPIPRFCCKRRTAAECEDGADDTTAMLRSPESYQPRLLTRPFLATITPSQSAVIRRLRPELEW